MAALLLSLIHISVRDLPLHVDFMRLGEGATIRVNIPIHVRNAEQSPGVKRGGTVSIVTHTIEVRCRADAIPTGIDVDVSELEINYSKHLSDITLPEGVRVVAGRDITLVLSLIHIWPSTTKRTAPSSVAS